MGTDEQSVWEWRALIAKGKSLVESGKYGPAFKIAKRAMEVAQTCASLDELAIATSANLLGEVYFGKGQRLKAEPLLYQALKIREARLGSDHPDVAECLNNVAVVNSRGYPIAATEQLYRRVLAIWERSYGPMHSEVAVGLFNVAHQCRLRGDNAEAESLFRRALMIREKVNGPEHHLVARVLSELAMVCWTTWRFDEAVALFERVLESDTRRLGRAHLSLVTTLMHLSSLKRLQGKDGEALKLRGRVLAIRLLRQGAANTETAEAFYSIGGYYKDLGWLNDAVWYYRQALVSWERAGDLHQMLAALCCSYLAVVYYKLGRLDEATERMRRSLVLWERAEGQGPESLFIITFASWLITICLASGQYGVAELQARRTLAMCERCYGPEERGYADLLYGMAALFARTGRMQEAEEYRRRAETIRKE